MCEPDIMIAMERVGGSVPSTTAPAPLWVRLAGVASSLIIHLGVAAAAIYVLPAAPSPESMRGGADQAIEIALVGEEELDSTIAGARAEMVSLILPPEAEQPVPELERQTTTPPVDSPEIVQPAPQQSDAIDIVVPLPEEPPPPIFLEPTKPASVPSPKPQPVNYGEPRNGRVPSLVKMQLAPKKERSTKAETGSGEAAANRMASNRAGTGGVAATAGANSIAGYRAKLIAHLTRYKSYPEQAQDRGITGRNAVTVTFSREGTVLSATLSNPSGHVLLDSATLVALRRAQPFPPMPEGGPGSITVTIGLNYELR